MSTSSTNRLLNDFKKLKDDAPVGISRAPSEDNIFLWDCTISGPLGTPWEDGILELALQFKPDYPMSPPKVKFVSNMFHPNVYEDGRICLDILRDQWSPAYRVATILMSIQSLLSYPNINSPANLEAALLYSQDPKEYERRVRKEYERRVSKRI